MPTHIDLSSAFLRAFQGFSGGGIMFVHCCSSLERSWKITARPFSNYDALRSSPCLTHAACIRCTPHHTPEHAARVRPLTACQSANRHRFDRLIFFVSWTHGGTSLVRRSGTYIAVESEREGTSQTLTKSCHVSSRRLTRLHQRGLQPTFLSASKFECIRARDILCNASR